MLAFAVAWTVDRYDDLSTAQDSRDRLTLAAQVSDVVVAARSSSLLAASVADPSLAGDQESDIRKRHSASAARLEQSSEELADARSDIAAFVDDGTLRQITRGLERRQELERRVLEEAPSGGALGARVESQLFQSTRSVSELLNEAIEQLTTRDGVAIPGAEVLGDVSALPTGLYAEAQTAIAALFARQLTPRTAAELIGFRTARASLAEELESELPVEVRPSLEGIGRSTEADELAELASAVERAAAAGREPPERGRSEIANAQLSALAQIEALDALGEDLATTLDARAQADIADARDDLIVAAVVTLVLGALTVGLIVAILRSVGPSVRGLMGRANEIQQGELAVADLPEQGPPEIRVLTRSFNEMTETLRGVGERAEALADTDTAAELESEPLPGAIGRALDASVARLTSATGRLRAREALASSIVETAAEAVWSVDADGIVRSANEAAEAISGYGAREIVGQPAASVSTIAAVCERVGEEYQGSTAHLRNVELQLPHRDDHSVPASVSTTAIEDEDGRQTLMIFAFDISERYEQERLLEYEATHDPLTGLPNRVSGLAAIAATLERARAHPQGCGVIFLDLDNFKHFNDALGHAFGDRLLVQVARRIGGFAEPTSTVARLGGDEFIVVGLTASADAAAASARRIVHGLDRPFRFSGDRVWVSGSVGVAWSPDGSLSAEDMLRDADIALFRAKAQGPGTHSLFDDSMRRETEARAGTEVALRRALESGGLADRYQPLVDLESRQIVAAELLARLPTQTGEVPPAEFIKVAEETGTIVDLGRWALTTACRRLAQLEAAGNRSVRISVNISALHLAGGQLVRDVLEAANPAGDIAGRLGLEITESFLLRDERSARQTLAQLRDLGIVVSLDDFGTGYSSLSYLRDLPVDEIKVDRVFVSRMEQSPIDRAIIESVARLAAARDLRVVAEGIETEAQAERSRQIGCDLGQGFFFARPVGFQELEQLLRS